VSLAGGTRGSPFASLPMYDRPQNAAAHDALWALIRDSLRARGVEAPETLDRAMPVMAGWQSPDLLLGQVCNLPWRALLRDRLTLLCTGDYGLADTAPGLYRSVLIVRAEDAAADLADCAGHRFVYSDPLSHSGWGAAQAEAAARGLRLNVALQSGAHSESLRAVAEGRADLASIDAQSFAMFRRWEPDAARVKVIGTTAASPGMSFVTAAGRNPAPVRAALHDAVAALPAAHRATLGLRGLVTLAPAAYDLPVPPSPEAYMRDLGSNSPVPVA